MDVPVYRSAESLVLGPELVDLADALREADRKLLALGGSFDPPGTERSEFVRAMTTPSFAAP